MKKQTQSPDPSSKENNMSGLPVRRSGKEAVRTREIADSSLVDEVIPIDITSDYPAICLENPDEVIPYEKLSPKLRDLIILNYGENFLKTKVWTVGIMRKLAMAVGRPRENMTSNIAQVCSPNCTYSDLCPHNIVGVPPLGERCPQELALIRLLFSEYMTAVAERLNADEEELRDDIIYHNLVMGLVESDIISMRLDGSLAKDGFITSSVSAINEESGEVFYKEEEAIAIRVKDRVFKRKDQLYRQLLATPEMAEKYKKKSSMDVISKSVEVLNKIDEMMTNLSIRHAKDAEIVDK